MKEFRGIGQMYQPDTQRAVDQIREVFNGGNPIEAIAVLSYFQECDRRAQAGDGLSAEAIESIQIVGDLIAAIRKECARGKTIAEDIVTWKEGK